MTASMTFWQMTIEGEDREIFKFNSLQYHFFAHVENLVTSQREEILTKGWKDGEVYQPVKSPSNGQKKVFNPIILFYS